jgi:hypothetical protein
MDGFTALLVDISSYFFDGLLPLQSSRDLLLPEIRRVSMCVIRDSQ